MTTTHHVPQIEGPASPQPGRRWTGPKAFIAAAVVVLLLGGAAGALAIFRLMDGGAAMASASAMPADTEIYIDIDFQSLDNLDPMLESFDAAFADSGVQPGLDGLIDLVDERLIAELGIGVDDVTPWVGRDLGIGISGIRLDATEFDARLVAALAVRDEAGADSFIDRMVDSLSARGLETFGEARYQDVELRVSVDDFDGQQIVVGRSGDLLLIGNSETAVHHAIDAQAGTSLADDATMEELFAALPDERAITIYVRGDAMRNAFDQVTGQLSPLEAAVPQPDFTSGAVSVALTEEGVQFDFVELLTVDSSDGSTIDAAPEGRGLASRLPSSAFGYVAFGGDTPLFGDATTIDDILAEAGVPEPDRREITMQLGDLEEELGFDIAADFLAHLGGELGFALLEADRPLFGDVDAPYVGALGLVGVTDAVAVADTAAQFVSFLGDLDVTVTPRDIAGATLYGIGDAGADFALFGVSGDYFVVATDGEHVAALDDADSKLADDVLYQRAITALPFAGDPLFFFDLGKALQAFDAPPEAVSTLAPIEAIVANSEVADEISRLSVVVLVDY